MFLKLLQNRRSIRKFKDKSVEQEKVNKLIEAALRSPSSRGINPWEIIAVTDNNIIKKLSDAKMNGSNFLENAPLCFIICGIYEKSDVWIEDTSIVSIILSLAAESLGLGSCWIQIRNRMHNDKISSDEYIKKIINIPQELNVESIIAAGYPDEKKEPHNYDELDFHKVHYNKFV